MRREVARKRRVDATALHDDSEKATARRGMSQGVALSLL